MTCDGELILDKPRIKALLIVSISVPFSDDKHKKLDMPSVIFSHAIPLVGKVSSALGEVVNQDMLLSYLCHKCGMSILENRLLSAESGGSEGCSFETVGEDSGHRKSTAKATKCLDVVLVMQSTELILQTVEESWSMRRSCSISDVRTTLRY
jgi:integrator complex subunit 4